jgi:hypothetical protein
MRVVAALSFVVFLMAAPLAAQEQGIREEHPNLVGVELGGRALLYNIFYERYVTQQIGLGAGLEGFGTSDGAVVLIPLWVSLVPLGNIHSLYLSAGATYAAASNWEELESLWFGTVAAGFFYQSVGGFFVRPTITMLFRDEGFLVLPSVSLGGSF